MVLVEIMKVITGFEAAWTMSSMLVATDCLLRRLRPHLFTIVCILIAKFIISRANKFIAAVAEAAVVGIADELTGQTVNAFVSLKDGKNSPEMRKELTMQVRKSIGPFAAPKVSYSSKLQSWLLLILIITC